MKKWYHIFPAAFSVTECAEIVAESCKIPPVKASVGHGSGNTVNESIRKSTVRWLCRHDEKWLNMFNRFEALGREANGKFFGFNLSHFESPQFTEYSATNEQHYNWHQDNTFVPSPEAYTPFDRKLSMVLQCTPKDNYEGGELWVNPSREQKVEGFSEVGSLIVFPSFLWHKVTPVTKGVRHSLVCWHVGPRFS